MKLFKRIAAVLLAGVLAVGVLAGCSNAPTSPDTPKPTDPEALAIYQGIADTCGKYNVKTPTYKAELDNVAKSIAEGTTISKYYNTTPNTVIDAAKASVAAMADGAEYIGYALNPYETVAQTPLSTSELKDKIVKKGADSIGISVITLKDASNNDVKYACIVYARIPDTAAQD